MVTKVALAGACWVLILSSTRSLPAQDDPKPLGANQPAATPSKPVLSKKEPNSDPAVPSALQDEPADAAAVPNNPNASAPTTTILQPAGNPIPTALPSNAALPTAPTVIPPVGSPVESDGAQILKVLTDIQSDIASLKKTNWVKDVAAPLLAPLVALVALLVTYRLSGQTLRLTAEMNRATLESKSHEEERKSIREKRDRFYGPYLQLRGMSNYLYGIFKARRTEEERQEYCDKDGNFRTLIALCRGHIFMGVDKVLLEEIIRIGDESSALIIKEIGLVDNPELQAGLSRAMTHYRIIKLAMERKLLTTNAEFDDFTFPKRVDELIQQQIKTLDARLQQLEQLAPSQIQAQAGGKSK